MANWTVWFFRVATVSMRSAACEASRERTSGSCVLAGMEKRRWESTERERVVSVNGGRGKKQDASFANSSRPYRPVDRCSKVPQRAEHSWSLERIG